MANLSAYLEGLIVAWLRGTNFPAPPTSLQLALSSGDPTDTGAGLVEPAGAKNYARQTITFSDAVSDGENGTTISSATDVTFGPASAAFIPVAHVAVYDDSSNLLFFAPMNVQRTAATGDTISFAAGAVALTMLPPFTNAFSEAILNWVRGVAMPAAPAALTQAVSFDVIGADTEGLNEPNTGDGYTRRPVSFAPAVNAPGVGTTLTTDSDVVFGPVQTNDWGQIEETCFFTDSGLMLFSGAIASPRIVLIGDTVPIAAGSTTLLIR